MQTRERKLSSLNLFECQQNYRLSHKKFIVLGFLEEVKHFGFSLSNLTSLFADKKILRQTETRVKNN